MNNTEPFERLMEALRRLPGVGRRSAERMAMRLVRDRRVALRELLAALRDVEKTVRCCSVCGSITTAEKDPCRLCMDTGRDDSILCVVEDSSDIALVERSGGFRGRYHALMGKISPMQEEGLGDLRLRALLKRVENGGFDEIVLALSTDVEGDATASFIKEMLKRKAGSIKISRLAFGLPAGSAVMYSDPVTLSRAIKGRQEA